MYQANLLRMNQLYALSFTPRQYGPNLLSESNFSYDGSPVTAQLKPCGFNKLRS